MKHRLYTSYNPYFFIPFCIWLITGGIALIVADKETLFTFFNSHHTTWSDSLMFAITEMGEAWFITIVLLILLGFSRFRNWWYFTLAILANVLPALITQGVKNAVGAPRPLKYFGEATWIHTLPQWPRLLEHSFPSGHTCGAFAFYSLMSMLLVQKYRWWGVAFFILALMVGYSRMYLAAHFFEDVYVGSIIGTIVSLLAVLILSKSERFFLNAKD